jgi:UDP-N-acetylglucosamine 2-epimerase (non-hydrolysing)
MELIALKSPFSVMTVFGTRPEAIKMAPIIKELKARDIDQTVCVTGQHREMLHQMLSLFDIIPDHDLDVMTDGQTLEDITGKVLIGMRDIYLQAKPDFVLVQGDTNSAFAAALGAFYLNIPVGHVEAGLRTNNIYDPFPEEMSRRLITRVATLHFAPTGQAHRHLIDDGVDESYVHITGNTVIDALYAIVERDLPFDSKALHDLKIEELAKTKKIIVVTAHRRENLGGRMKNIFSAIARLAKDDGKDCLFIFPVHPNPKVRKQATELLGGLPNVHLIEPLSYSDLTKLMKLSHFIMTDSGGIQEEAPALNKPVVVLRETTERGEGLEAGTAVLAGGEDEDRIYTLAKRLLTDKQLYDSMANATNPYGDGTAAQKIVNRLEAFSSNG